MKTQKQKETFTSSKNPFSKLTLLAFLPTKKKKQKTNQKILLVKKYGMSCFFFLQV